MSVHPIRTFRSLWKRVDVALYGPVFDANPRVDDENPWRDGELAALHPPQRQIPASVWIPPERMHVPEEMPIEHDAHEAAVLAQWGDDWDSALETLRSLSSSAHATFDKAHKSALQWVDRAARDATEALRLHRIAADRRLASLTLAVEAR